MLRDTHLPMKPAFFSLLCLAIVLTTGGNDSPYQAELMKIMDRYTRLETERSHPVAPRRLSEADEKERRQLLGQLIDMDPIWVIVRELEADIRALLTIKPAKPGDEALLEDLKSFMAFTAGVQQHAKDLEEAEQLANTIRGFIIRGDVEGLGKWVKSLP